MKSDFLLAITQLAAERNLPKDVVLSAVEAALTSAFRKDEATAHQNISVRIHPVSGEVKVYTQKAVVESVEDGDTEIAARDAVKLNKNAKVGQVLAIETTAVHGGRIAAQTAKQVVLQRLREAEREFVFGEYADREGEIISGVVSRIEPRQIIIIDLGKAEAILPPAEQVRTERYRVGQRLKVYLLEVNKTNKGPRLVVSRSHPSLLRRLFELEVPEIHSGTVEIRAVAREASARSKVAVYSRQEAVDAVGSCVGLRGVRIQNVVNELNGERIDVIQWDPDPKSFIANALSPARVVAVELDAETGAAEAVVPDGQLSLAIGRDGQNARLAAKLTGWKIDIKAARVAEAERAARETEVPPAPVAVAEKKPVAVAEAVAAPPKAAPVEAPPVEVPAVAAAAPMEAAEVLVQAEVPEVAEVEELVEEELTAAEEEAEEMEEFLEPLPVEEKKEVPEAAPGRPQLRFAEDIFGTREFGGGRRGRKGKGREEEREGRGGRRARKGRAAAPARPGEDVD